VALTDYEKHLVFEVLGVPNSASVLYIDTQWATGKTSQTGAILVSRDEILLRMDGLSAALEQRLRELLEAWGPVAATGTKIRPNAANEGVDVDPARERARIRELVQRIVPVILEGRDTGGGGTIPLG